jgi:hypothetical protein
MPVIFFLYRFETSQGLYSQKRVTNFDHFIPSICAVYSDIKYLQKLHFLLYDELHSFLTERQSNNAAAGVGGANGQVLADTAMN